MLRFVLVILLLFGFVLNSSAQAHQSATASATVVAPINLLKVNDLNFGNISVNSLGGIVNLSPAGTRTFAGGVTLPTVSGTVSPAEFMVTGMQEYTYSITLPSSVIINNTYGTGGETMLVDMFISDPVSTGNLGTGGSQSLNIGATVHVTANQAHGTYVSATPFDVSVNYN